MTFPSEDHRRRLENIAACECGIRKCLRKHLITGYIQGQVSHNLGEYRCRKLGLIWKSQNPISSVQRCRPVWLLQCLQNLELYLALANYGASEVRVETADADLLGNEA